MSVFHEKFFICSMYVQKENSMHCYVIMAVTIFKFVTKLSRLIFSVELVEADLGLRRSSLMLRLS